MKQIKVTIKPDGSTEVDAIGFTGTSCKDATKPIEEALGKVTTTKAKPEQFVNPPQQNRGQAGGSYGW